MDNKTSNLGTSEEFEVAQSLVEAHFYTLRDEIERLREENQALRNLAENLRPGPISQALQDSPDYSGQTIERLRAALERLTNGYKYPAEVCQIAREALSDDGSAPETRKIPPREFDIESHQGLYTEPLAPETSPNELTEAERLLQAWADLLPPNGDLYWVHVEKAREYFKHRGCAQETTERPHVVNHAGDCESYCWCHAQKASVEPAVLDRMVTVCDKCLCACCWHGEFMCDEAKSAGTVDKSIRDLLAIGEPRESNEYWFKSPANGKIDQAGLHALRAYLAEKGTQNGKGDGV